MLMFIQRHRIEKRLGNLNPDPIVPMISSKAIPRHIVANTEEHDIYMTLHTNDLLFPVYKDKP